MSDTSVDPFATEEPFVQPETEPAGANGSQAQPLDLTTHGESLVTVRVDGEDVTVPLSEAVQGYSRTQDYTRKTQALADERTNLEAGLEEVRQYRQWGAQIGSDPQAALTSIAEAYGVDPGGVGGNIDDSYGDESRKVAQLEAQVKSLGDQMNRQGAASDIERETKQVEAAGLTDDPEALLQYAAAHKFSQGQLTEAAKAMAYEELKAQMDYISSIGEQQDATDQAIVEQKVGLPPQAGGALRGGPQPVSQPGSPGEKVPFSDAFNQALTQYTNS